MWNILWISSERLVDHRPSWAPQDRLPVLTSGHRFTLTCLMDIQLIKCARHIKLLGEDKGSKGERLVYGKLTVGESK